MKRYQIFAIIILILSVFIFTGVLTFVYAQETEFIIVNQEYENLKNLTKQTRVIEKSLNIKDNLKIQTNRTEDYNIEIVNSTVLNNGIEVQIRVYDHENKQFGFGKDGTIDIERFIIINPPILIEDINGSISIDQDGTIINYEINAEQAILKVLNDSIRIKKYKYQNKKIKKDSVSKTTYVIFPYNDGLIKHNDATTGWANVRDASTGTLAQDTINEEFAILNTILVREDGGGDYDITRAGYVFDTSSVTDTIDSAVLSVKYTNLTNGDNDANAFVTVTGFTPATNGDFVNADYNQFGTTALSDQILISNMQTADLEDYTLNATGISSINTSGYTALGHREGHDFNNVAIDASSSNQLTAQTSDTVGTTLDPRITIETSTGGTGTTTVITATSTAQYYTNTNIFQGFVIFFMSAFFVLFSLTTNQRK